MSGTSPLERLYALAANGRWRAMFLSALLLDVAGIVVLRKLLRWLLGWNQIQEIKRAQGQQQQRLALNAREEEEQGLEAVDLSQDKGPLVLAIDCDGTLFNENGEITERTKRALRRFAARGGAVVLATGHPNMSIKRTALELGCCNSFAICSSGAVVMTAPNWEVKVSNSIPVTVACRVAATAQKIDPEVQVAVEGTRDWFVQSQQFFAELDSSMPGANVGSKIAKIGRVCAEGESLSTLVTTAGGPDFGAVRVMLIHPRWTSEELLERVRPVVSKENAAHGSELEASHAGAPRGVMVTVRKAHKGVALTQVCSMLGVPLSRAVAFGDNQNDIDMLRVAGQGLAVANATPELKAVATRVLEHSNAEDAVAREVENILSRWDDRAMMRDNLRRLTLQVNSCEAGIADLQAENAVLADSVLRHERVAELIAAQTPARVVQSPTLNRKRSSLHVK